MSNPNKDKGDEAERELVRALVKLVPDRCVEDPMRMLGAGRKDDVGDVRALPDVAIQVKAFKPAALSAALGSAARGAKKQAANARARFGVGAVRVTGAKRDGTEVRWIVSVQDWPVLVDPFVHTNSVDAFEWVRLQGVDRHDAIIRVQRAGVTPIILASLQTWLKAWETAITSDDEVLSAVAAPA